MREKTQARRIAQAGLRIEKSLDPQHSFWLRRDKRNPDEERTAKREDSLDPGGGTARTESGFIPGRGQALWRW